MNKMCSGVGEVHLAAKIQSYGLESEKSGGGWVIPDK